jgi:hypothetical protein
MIIYLNFRILVYECVLIGILHYEVSSASNFYFSLKVSETQT